jgi:HSP20 family protein
MFNKKSNQMSILFPTIKNGSSTKDLGYSGFPSMSTWIDDIINSNFNTNVRPNFNTGMTLPAVNISESETDYVVEMAIPGLKKSDFNISVEDDMLTITSEHADEVEQSERNYTRREYGYS